jgi:hypothetical protein
MICRDVREVADSFLCDELLKETNHEILQHLNTCPSCRSEVDARRQLRGALRTAFERAPELQPHADFTKRLRAQLREVPATRHRSWMPPRRWLGLAAGVVIAAALSAALLLNRSTSADVLARDAIGDHQNCALAVRMTKTPMPLEEAAERFDRAFLLLLDAPPTDFPTADGPVHVVGRHSCAFGSRRFGHVIMEYRGRVVSLLMTANDSGDDRRLGDAPPRLIGRPQGGLSVVSVDGSRHAILLVSDLGTAELTQLSKLVSAPLALRLNGSLNQLDPHALAALQEPLPLRHGLLNRQD